MTDFNLPEVCESSTYQHFRFVPENEENPCGPGILQVVYEGIWGVQIIKEIPVTTQGLKIPIDFMGPVEIDNLLYAGTHFCLWNPGQIVSEEFSEEFFVGATSTSSTDYDECTLSLSTLTEDSSFVLFCEEEFAVTLSYDGDVSTFKESAINEATGEAGFRLVTCCASGCLASSYILYYDDTFYLPDDEQVVNTPFLPLPCDYYQLNLQSDTTNTSEIVVRESLKPSVTLYPNPAAFNCIIEANMEIHNVEVLDVQGKQVYCQKQIEGISSTLYLDNLKKGIYFVNIQLGNEMVTRKLVKI